MIAAGIVNTALISTNHHGTDVFGIPGSNAGFNGNAVTGPGSADLDRYSGLPVFDVSLSDLGNNAGWTPVWRDERSYTFSTNLTITIN